MPDDLLRYLDGPMRFSVWWLVLGVIVLLAVIVWCVGIFVWTLPAQQLRRIPVVRSLHARLIRRRFAHSIHAAREQHRSGELSDRQAASAMKRTLRSFLSLQTGSRVQYMHMDDITAASDLAPTAPVFTALDDVQFNTTSRVDLDGIGREAEELIRSWS